MRLRASLLALLLAGSPAGAQSVGRMLETDGRNFFGDVWAVWVSPFQGSAGDYGLAALTLAGGAAVSVIDDDVDRWVVRHRDDRGFNLLQPVREGGIAFSGQTITPVVGGLYIIALATKNEKLRDGIVGCGAGYVATSVLRNQVLYRLVSRTRPDSSRHHDVAAPPAAQGDQYDIDFGSSAWGRHSFPAGHVANIAACASFLSHRFSMGAAEPLVYALTAAVGVGRIVDRRHWTSDTVIGIVFGYASGKLVAERSRRRYDAAHPVATPNVTPGPGSGFYLSPGSNGMTLGWSRTF